MPSPTRVRAIWLIVLIVVLFLAGVAACVPQVLGKALIPSPTLPVAAAGAPETLNPHSFELFPANVALFRAVNSHRALWLDQIVTAVTRLEFAWLLLLVLPLTGILRPTKVKPLLWAFVVETILVHACKAILDTPRPPSLLDQVYLMQPFYHGSFPSGDVALAAVMAVVLSSGERWWIQALFGLFVLLVALERLYVGVHFPLDVLSGALVGIISGVIILRLPKKNTATQG